MFLKRIELQGFKSFADKTNLEFLNGITTVIGPNGSGKSNIVDAFRWVLGEQSIKNLRGNKSDDVIFAGTQARRSVGFAEVNLVIDNTDGSLPIEYDEVVVTRRLYRSGESEYLINKCECRLKDISQLFFNTGVGKGGYSIIGQGKVEEILNSKSDDRRYIFEEAAGILKYRYRKDEAERKLDNTNTNLIRVNDIVNEIDSRLDGLYSQSEKAKKFLNYREELKTKEISLFNFNMQKNSNTLQELNEKYDILNNQIKDEEDKLVSVQEKKTLTKENIEDILSKQENIQRFMYESDNNIEKLNSEINMIDVQKENNVTNFSVLDKEIIELNELIQRNEQEILTKSDKIELLLNNRKKFETDLAEKEEEYNEIYQKLSKKGEEIEQKKQYIYDSNEKKMNIKMEINTLNNEKQNNEHTYSKIDKEQRENIYAKDSRNMQKEDISILFNNILKTKKEYEDKINKINDVQNNINSKIQEFDNNIENYTTQMKSKKARYTFLNDIQKEREGYARAVKEILLNKERNSEFNKGVEGSIADIIMAPQEYELAIEMALGGYLQNIVTLNEQSAKKCIDYLKQNNYGRASFLPISLVKGKRLSDVSKLEKEKGYVGIASNLVKYNSKYEEIIVNLLGKTLVVETIDDGINISKKYGNSFKIVTLQGDIISTSGQMTGGSIQKKSSSILGRTKEIETLEREIKKLEKNIEEESNKKEVYLNSIDNTDINYSEINEKLNNVNIEYAIENQKLQTIENEIDLIEKRNEKIRIEKENIEQRNKEIDQEINTKQLEVDEMETEISKLQLEIDDYSQNSKDEQKYIDDLKDEITDLKISISSFDESNVSYEEMINMVKDEIEKAKSNIEKKNDQKQKILIENEEFEVKKKEIFNNINEIISKKENINEEIEKTKNEKEENNRLIDVLDKQIEDSLNTISLLKTDLTKIESKKVKVEDEVESLKTTMIEEYEIPLEELMKQEVEALEPNKVQREINVIKREIKGLGAINIEAIEEYKTNKERYDFLSNQRDDLENTASKLKNLIKEMTVIMKEQFKVKFKVINENFGVVFEKLFGGGRAEIRLTDENDILNCPIEIEAQPPGKKLQNMMLLSGGEKSLTAIALLFGILTTNPSPFCILDEIEAALDDINIFRFAQYVKEYANNTQFLIITHRKGTMEIADTMYGVTMQEQGVSKLISMKV